MAYSPGSNLKIALRIRNPAARDGASSKWMKIPACQLDRVLQRRHRNDLLRAPTEFGQQAHMVLSAGLYLEWDMSQSAIALLRLFCRRLLNLNGGNPIRLRRINRDDSKIPIQVARTNGYC